MRIRSGWLWWRENGSECCGGYQYIMSRGSAPKLTHSLNAFFLSFFFPQLQYVDGDSTSAARRVVQKSVVFALLMVPGWARHSHQMFPHSLPSYLSLLIHLYQISIWKVPTSAPIDFVSVRPAGTAMATSWLPAGPPFWRTWRGRRIRRTCLVRGTPRWNVFFRLTPSLTQSLTRKHRTGQSLSPFMVWNESAGWFFPFPFLSLLGGRWTQSTDSKWSWRWWTRKGIHRGGWRAESLAVVDERDKRRRRRSDSKWGHVRLAVDTRAGQYYSPREA